MDIRDQRFWFREARKKDLRDEIRMMQSARIAMAEGKDYERIVHKLHLELKKISFGEKEVYSEGWSSLRAIDKG